MPAYHSSIESNVRHVKSIPLLPLKTSIRGPAPTAEPESVDILDDTLSLFRANSFFRNFEIKSPADIILIYTTLFIQECLGILSNKPLPITEATKILLTHANRSFPIPGEPGFPLNAVTESIETKEDSGNYHLF